MIDNNPTGYININIYIYINKDKYKELDTILYL